MNILICDDLPDDALVLEKTIKETGFKGTLVLFNNGADALSYIKTGAKIDICFLDIIMPEMNGIELARLLRKADYKGEIVFLSTSHEYGVETYQVEAFTYILKPPDSRNMERIIQEISARKKTTDTAGLLITTRILTRFLFFNEISHVEVIEHNVYFRLLDGSEIAVYAALSEFLPVLMADGRFAQSHRSYVINMDAISNIQGRDIYLRCGRKTPIAKGNKEFSKLYYSRIFTLHQSISEKKRDA